MVVNNLPNYNVYKIFYWVGFVDKNKFIVFDKMFYNNEDVIITGIINKIFKFR